jgi:hypothetical protein
MIISLVSFDGRHAFAAILAARSFAENLNETVEPARHSGLMVK